VVGPPDYFFEKICGVAPLPLQPKNFAQNNSVLIQIANNTFLSVYPCSQDRIRTCNFQRIEVSRVRSIPFEEVSPFTPPD